MLKLSRATTGWVLYDFANSAFATIILAVIFNRYFAEVIAGGPDGLTYHLFNWELQIPGASMWGFLVAISTAIVAISAPFLGSMADLAGWRKRMLLIYCYLGVAGTILLVIPSEGEILLTALIFIMANFGFAGGNVFYNSFILDISRRESLGRISGLAWGLGYLGGGLSLVICLVMLEQPNLLGLPAGYFDVKHCIILAGIWWGVFALPTMMWLKDKNSTHDRISPIELSIKSWRRLVMTFREVRKHRQLVKFLFAFLFFNDGIETVIIMAAIFGAEVIGMATGELVIFFLIIQGTALVGSFFFGWLADIFQRKTILLITISIWLGVVTWAYTLGWLIDARTDFYLIGILAGLAMGGSQTTARSLQASFTPKDKAAEFFGFFAVSGRFASVFGPLIYGIAIIVAGGTQPAIIVIGGFFIIGGAILMTVNEEEGIAAAGD